MLSQSQTTGCRAARTKPAASRNADVPENLNSVRGLACLLVVALHVVGDAGSNGLHLPMTSGWHYAMGSIEFLRIPLFTALSGYLYASRRVTKAGFPGFWAKKLRRLAVPLIFATIVMWWLRQYTHRTHASLLHALLFEFGHLWFLQSLLVLFIAISVADAFFRPSAVSIVLAGLTAIMISQAGLAVTTFFGIAGALYLAPYFLFGILLRDHPGCLRDPRSGTLALGVIATVLTSQQLGLFGLFNEVTLLQMPAAIAGMAGVVFLLQRFPSNTVLASIGQYSYTIYLWHIFAAAAVRQVLLKAGMTNTPLLFMSIFPAALAAPIVMHQVARRIPLLSVAITGDWWIPLTDKPLIVNSVARMPAA